MNSQTVRIIEGKYLWSTTKQLPREFHFLQSNYTRNLINEKIDDTRLKEKDDDDEDDDDGDDDTFEKQ